MRKLIANAFVSLDGVVQDPGGFGELENGGWALGYFDEASQQQATEAMLATDTFLLGRTTYEIIEKAWSKNTGPYAEAMHKVAKVVVSRTLQGKLPWNATTLPGDAAQTVAQLKQEPQAISATSPQPPPRPASSTSPTRRDDRLSDDAVVAAVYGDLGSCGAAEDVRAHLGDQAGDVVAGDLRAQ